MTPVLPAGTPVPITGAGPAFETLRGPDVDARNALAEALVAFIACLKFTRSSSGAAVAEDFNIPEENIYRVWPEPSQTMGVVAATVLDTDDVEEDGANFVPFPLEDTFETICPCSVLWKVAEVSATFQVDFWADNEANREAFAKLLPGAFSPDEGRYGIVLSTGPRYFGQPARFTLLSMSRRGDDPGSIYPRERRLMCMIRGDVDDVVLRRATLGSIRNTVVVDGNSG